MAAAQTLYYNSFSDLPVLMLCTIYRNLKFLKEVQDVQLTEKQIGNIHLPFYMMLDDHNHKNPTHAAIFDAAPPLAEKRAKQVKLDPKKEQRGGRIATSRAKESTTKLTTKTPQNTQK
ncbi:hypothetical protein B0H13DRAFT_2354500 [Mycena leptocephala]|nr:hypothetical protein B0H13DRAFT_2354500 [Mycena leptocephala]